MKKILRPVMAIFLLLSLCFTTSSCGAGNNEEAYDRSELTGVKNRVEYALPDDHNSGIMPCGEAIKSDTYYFCYSEDSNLYTLDLATGERGHVDLSPVCPGLLTIDDRLYVQDTATNCIAAYDVTTLSKSNNIELPTSASAVTAIDCYDGALYLTSETSLFVSKKGFSGWDEYSLPMANMKNASVKMLRANGKTVCALVIEYVSDEIELEIGGTPYQIIEDSLFSFDLTTSQMSLLSQSSGAIDACNGDIYYMNGDTSVNMIRDGKTETVFFLPEENTTTRYSEIGMAVSMLRVSNDTFFFSGSIGFDSKVVLYPLMLEDALTIIGTNDMLQTLTLYGVKADEPLFNSVILDDDLLIDKVTMKLVAGDTDFDIAYVTGEADEIATMLDSLVRYHQYIDLAQDDRLQDAFADMYPGTLNMLTTSDGEIFCLPVSAAFTFYGLSTTSVLSAGITMPSSDWTADEFFALCDELIQSGSDYSLFPSMNSINYSVMLVKMLQGHLQSRDLSEEEAQQEIADFLERLEPYADAGILFGNRPLFSVASTGMFDDRTVSDQVNTLTPVLFPVMEEGDTIPLNVTGFLFINPNSEHVQESLDFLAAICNETLRYRVETYDEIPLWPTLSDYYFAPHVAMEKSSEFAASGINHSYYAKLDELMETYLQRSSLCTLPSSYEANQAMDNFCHGKIDLETATNIIYRQLVYIQKG